MSKASTYAPIEAKLDRVQGANSWLTLSLREGKNREVRCVLGSLGLDVNRLIRVPRTVPARRHRRRRGRGSEDARPARPTRAEP